jgi:hypothetical protein
MAGCLFAYWHFEESVLVIEDEFAEARQNSRAIAGKIVEKEQKLWKGLMYRHANGSLRPQPYKRFSDNDPRLLYDLAYEYDLAFVPTLKDNLLQQVDAVRVAVQDGKIWIHPRCTKLIAQMENGIWKKAPGARSAGGKRVQPTFAREGEDFGHFDLIAAVIYLWRMAEKRRNPVPENVRIVAGQFPEKGNTGTSKWERHGKQGRWSKALETASEAAKSKWQTRGQKLYIKTGK